MLDNAWSAAAFTEAGEEEEEEEEEGEGAEAAEAEAGSVSTPSWRSWGAGAFSALGSLDTGAVARLAGSALATVRRDFTEFGLAVREDAKELGELAEAEALPELRHAAAGLQETLETVGEGIESAGASFFANLAQARSLPSAAPLLPARRAPLARTHARSLAAAALARPSARLTRRAPQVRDTILSENDANTSRRRVRGAAREAGEGGAPRPPPTLEQLVAAMQRDSSTYCEEPSDAAFPAFRADFSLAQRAEAVAAVLGGSAFIRELHSRIVPLVVDDDSFWARYFFRLAALQARHAPPPEPAREAEATEAAEAAAAGSDGSWCVVEAGGPEASEAAAEAVDAAAAEERAEAAVEAAPAPVPPPSAEEAQPPAEQPSEPPSPPPAPAPEPASQPPAPAAEPAEPASPPPAPPAATAGDSPRTPTTHSVADGPGDTPSPSPFPAGGAAGDEDVDEDWGME